MTAAVPVCKCGNAAEFILREFRRCYGTLRVEEERLIFKEQPETTDLETNAVLCGKCFKEVDTGDFFDVED